MAESKPQTIDQYITGFPENVQMILNKIRRTIAQAAPSAEEAISYGIPTFKLDGNLVHFAAYKSHIGFYPAPSGIEKFREELSGFVQAKGSVQFPLHLPIPYDLIKKITIFRTEEILTKSALKRKIRK